MDDLTSTLPPRKEDWRDRELKKRRGKIKRLRAENELLKGALEQNGIPIPQQQKQDNT